MQQPVAKDPDSRVGKIVIKKIAPTKLPIGLGQRDGVIYADGLFEEDELGNIVPKKDLIAAIMSDDGNIIDTIIVVEKITTDDISSDRVNVKITVPVNSTIKPNQYRNVLLKKRNEPLDAGGQCDPTSDNCSVAADVVELI